MRWASLVLQLLKEFVSEETDPRRLMNWHFLIALRLRHSNSFWNCVFLSQRLIPISRSEHWKYEWCLSSYRVVKQKSPAARGQPMDSRENKSWLLSPTGACGNSRALFFSMKACWIRSMQSSILQWTLGNSLRISVRITSHQNWLFM